MLDKIEQKRKWISDKLIQYVDIVFGLVVGQSIIRNKDLILDPTTYLFAFVSLVIVIVTVTLSWIGYHKSMYNYPYKAETLSKSFRPLTDFIIVVIYTRLLFTVDDFKVDPTRVNLSAFILCYALFFLLYVLDGQIRIWETKDLKASKRDINFVFFAAYAVLWILYLMSYAKNPYLSVTNYIVVLLCLAMYLSYRLWREKYYPKSTVTIVVDVDGVLADQVTPVLETINKKFGTNYSKNQILLWDQKLSEANTDIKTEIENSHKDADFILKMKPIDHAQITLMELAKYCDITIATNRPHSADRPTKRWLKENGIPFDTYVNTSVKGKGSIHGRFLVDDYPKNILEFAKGEKIGFLFSQPWNVNDDSLTENKNVVRVRGWQDVFDKIKSLEK